MIKEKEKKNAKINLDKLPFKIDGSKIKELSKDIANDLSKVLSTMGSNVALSWCLSKKKKAKVFTIIYQANENSETIYKEEIAKKLTEYSYKTIASIIDEGIEKGFYITLDQKSDEIRDKKIKNIRLSKEVTNAFLNWNIDRISSLANVIKKYK